MTPIAANDADRSKNESTSSTRVRSILFFKGLIAAISPLKSPDTMLAASLWAIRVVRVILQLSDLNARLPPAIAIELKVKAQRAAGRARLAQRGLRAESWTRMTPIAANDAD